MDKVIQNITRGGDDYKFKPEHILGLPAALKRLVNKIEYDPATRKLTITNDDAKELAAEIALASATQAGLMSAEMWEKLEGIDVGAQVNPQLGDLATIDRGGDSKTFLNGNGEWVTPPNDNTTDLTKMENVLEKSHGGTGNANGTIDQLTNSRNINGVAFNGTAAVDFGGYCSTAAATAAKTVAISGYNLTNYSTICVMFRYVNTASNPTLNVNGVGAYAIKLNNVATTKITSAQYQPVLLQFYSNAWHIVDPNANLDITPAGIGAAASSHSHTADDITSGTLPITKGGTGQQNLDNVTVGNANKANCDRYGNYIDLVYALIDKLGEQIWKTLTASTNLNEMTSPGFYMIRNSNMTNGPSDVLSDSTQTSYLITTNVLFGSRRSIMQLLLCSYNGTPQQSMYYRVTTNPSSSTGIGMNWHKVSYTA